MAFYYKELHAGYGGAQSTTTDTSFLISNFNNYTNYPYSFIFPDTSGLSFPNYSLKTFKTSWNIPGNTGFIAAYDGDNTLPSPPYYLPWEHLTEEAYTNQGWLEGAGLKANLKTLFSSFEYPSWWVDTLIVCIRLTVEEVQGQPQGPWPVGTKLIILFYYPGNIGDEEL